MPGRRRKARKPQRGQGKVGDFLKKAYNYVKDNKLISRGLNSLGSALPAQYGAIASKAGSVADQLGFGHGKRGRGRPRMIQM